MLQKTFKRALILGVFFASLTSIAKAQSSGDVSTDDIVGTWSGQSVCVTNQRGCKNEVVVYRFEPVGESSGVTLFADKLIRGKRVPLYKLDFQYDESRRTLSCESRGQPRGTWQFKVFNNRIEGTAIMLEGKRVEHRVKVRRAREDQLPAAPNRESYGP